jgi:4-amino-4-deoxy-L-arabinose transferase-like glycosyltransferase
MIFDRGAADDRNMLWKLFIAAFAVRIIVFVALLAAFGQEIFLMGDTVGYAAIAKNLLLGHGFSWDVAGIPVLQDFRPPLYPILLAGSLLLTGDFLPIIILQIVLASCIPVLVYLLGREFIEQKPALILAGGMAVFEPLLVFFSTYLLTDILFLFFSLLTVLFAVRFFKQPTLILAVFIGATLGVATLIRAVGEYFMLYILLFVVWKLWSDRPQRKQTLISMAAGVFVFAAIITPWTVRNFQTFGTVSVSSEGPWVLYFDYVPSLYVMERDLSFTDARAAAKEKLRQKYPEIDLSSRIPSSVLTRESIEEIWNEKYAVPKLQAINALWFFTNDNYSYHLDRFGLVPDRPPLFSPTQLLVQEGLHSVPKIFGYLQSVYFIPVIGRLFWIGITLLTIVGFISLYRARKEQRFIIVFVGGIILYYYFVSSPIGLAGEGRIRMPASPYLLLFASAGAFQMWNMIKRRSHKL